MATVSSIWTRKLDLLYLVFFIIHIPIMLAVDLVPIYPINLRPRFALTLRKWYIETYHDRFFVHPPPWFNAFMWMEAVYHLPLSIWAIPAILRDDPTVPLQLLVWAVQTSITTLVCVVEMASWDGSAWEDTLKLAQLYVPYLALACVMGVDMFMRLRSLLPLQKTKVP